MTPSDSIEFSIWMLGAMLNDIEARMWYFSDREKLNQVSKCVDQMREIVRQMENVINAETRS